MTRFLSRSKKSDGSYGSTRETAIVLLGFTSRVVNDTAVSNTNYRGKAVLSGKEIFSGTFDMKNILETKDTSVSLDGTPDTATANMSTE